MREELNPPARIRGRFNKHSPIELREEKKKWVQQQLEREVPTARIATALGVSPSSLYAFMTRRGIYIRKNKPRFRRWGRDLHSHAFTTDQLRKLEKMAKDWKCETLSEAALEIVRDALEEINDD